MSVGKNEVHQCGFDVYSESLMNNRVALMSFRRV